MRCSEEESATETGLRCISVHIHPALDSSRSEDSQLGPVGGMTSDRSEHFSSRSHVNIYYIYWIILWPKRDRPGLTSSRSHVNGALRTHTNQYLSIHIWYIPCAHPLMRSRLSTITSHMTSLHEWKKLYLTLWRHSFDMMHGCFHTWLLANVKPWIVLNK